MSILGGFNYGCKKGRHLHRGIRGVVRALQGLQGREEVMALTEAQKRAQEAYRKKSVKQATIRFYPTEADIWEWLQAQENRAGYVKSLIREDMERKAAER
jgi:hypothetical protein